MQSDSSLVPSSAFLTHPMCRSDSAGLVGLHAEPAGHLIEAALRSALRSMWRSAAGKRCRWRDSQDRPRVSAVDLDPAFLRNLDRPAIIAAAF